jgi:hypothetical protein
MAGARAEFREETKGRLDSLEDQVAGLHNSVGGLKRRVDAITKCTRVVFEGFDELEKLWVDKTSGDQPRWRELKEGFARAVAIDVCAHLSMSNPPGEATADKGVVHRFLLALGARGTVVDIYTQEKWSAEEQAKQRVKGTFVPQLAFSHEALVVQSCLEGMDALMRRASGLVVRGDEAMPGAAAAARPRRLVYNDKTPSERAKGRNKGKGKGAAEDAAGAGRGGGAAAAAAHKGGKNKGKGKGQKGSAKGRGRGRGA